MKWTHNRIPGFAIGVTAEQHDLVKYRPATVNFLPKDGVLAGLHVIRGPVPDYRATVIIRPFCIIARRKIRGWKKNVSRSSAVPPDYESLD